MSAHPYADRFPVNRGLPEQGRPRDEVLAEMKALAAEEDASWEGGRVSGTMYCGDHDHYAFLNDVFGLYAHVNILQRDICPSATRYEGEVIAMALDLFNTPEVLVAAKDLINGTSISVDLRVREVTYIHLLFDRHQVMWANGVETESFHPASAPLTSLGAQDRARLLAAHPQLAADPRSYGGFARRNLSTSEAAILRHVA